MGRHWFGAPRSAEHSAPAKRLRAHVIGAGRIVGPGLSALLLCGLAPIAGAAKPDTQDGVGEIVRPATGTDRAVYAPIDRPIILPPFLGTWAVRSGKCIGQSYRDRMELHTDLAIVAGEAFTVQATYVDVGPPYDRAGDEPLRSADYSNRRDMLVGLLRSGEEDTRFVHFRFSDRSGKLLVEEVGKPRRAFVRCAI